jgi:alpha-L-fucosidase 2
MNSLSFKTNRMRNLITIASFGLFAVARSAMAGTDVPPAETAEGYVRTLAGVYEKPVGKLGQFATNGPFTGNGDMRVVLIGTDAVQEFHISEADMWTDGGGKNKAVRQITTGTLTVSANALPEPATTRFRQEQHLRDARILADSAAGFRSDTVVCATENVMLTELAATGGQPLQMTVSLATKADAPDLPAKAGTQSGLMWATRRTKDSPRWVTRNALAAKIIGANPVFKPDGEGGTSAAFTLIPGSPVTIVTVLKGGRNAPDPLAATCARAAALDPQGIKTLRDAHSRWWGDYWKGTWLRTYDELWDRIYYGHLYLMGCVNRAGSTPAGQYPLCMSDEPGWQGDYHLNQEYLGQYCWAFSGNRRAGIDNVYQPLIDFIPEGKKIAAQKMKHVHASFGPHKGICYPVGLVPGGICSDYFYGNQVTDASYTGMLFIWNYEYYQDKEWLSKTGYPFLRLIGDFWESHLIPDTDASGRTRMVSFGASWEHKYGKNSILDLALARRVLTALITFSKDLGVDAEKRPQWQSLVDRLSELPTKNKNGKTVFVSFENCRDDPGYCDMEAPVFPSETIGLGSSAKERQTAVDTTALVSVKWKNPKLGVIGQRIGYPKDELYDAVKRGSITCAPGNWVGLRPNMTIGDFHGGGELLEFLQTGMLQSGGGEIRLFPAPPDTRRADFRELRARGAFLVSSGLKAGVVSGVTILSEKGRDCVVFNPWPGKSVKVYRNGTAAETVSGERFTLKTSENETLALSPE